MSILPAGVVILYNPENDVISNIHSYCSYLKRLYVYDNSEERNEKLIAEVGRITNAAYFHDGKNRGIATRLNQAAKCAIHDGFQWLLTMDQDSSFSSESIGAYLNCMNTYHDNALVAMFGVEHEELSSAGSGCKVVMLSSLITSGSFVNLDIWFEIGGFDESLFIDQVDHEYCYRAGLAGYKVLKFNTIYLDHHLGKVSLHRSLKSFTTTPRTLHSPVRIYYMVRNHLYVKKKYNAYFKKDIIISRNDLTNRIKNNLLYGKSKWLLIKFIFQAIFDFKNGNMGKKYKSDT